MYDIPIRVFIQIYMFFELAHPNSFLLIFILSIIALV